MLLPINIEVRDGLCSYHPKKCFYFKDLNPPYYRAVEYIVHTLRWYCSGNICTLMKVTVCINSFLRAARTLATSKQEFILS